MRLVLFGVLLVVVCLAQNPIQEPEYNNVYSHLDSTTGMLQPLERQTMTVTAKAKVLGFGGASAGYTVQGSKSPVRLTDQKPEFVVKMDTGGQDPSILVAFYALTSNKNSRDLTAGSSGTFVMGGKYKDQTHNSVVPFTIVKHGQNSFKVTPSAPLPPGEYVLGQKTSQQIPVYCFGIDASK